MIQEADHNVDVRSQQLCGFEFSTPEPDVLADDSSGSPPGELDVVSNECSFHIVRVDRQLIVNDITEPSFGRSPCLMTQFPQGSGDVGVDVLITEESHGLGDRDVPHGFNVFLT